MASAIASTVGDRFPRLVRNTTFDMPARCALKWLEPSSQIGTFESAPGTAMIFCSSVPGPSRACSSTTSFGKLLALASMLLEETVPIAALWAAHQRDGMIGGKRKHLFSNDRIVAREVDLGDALAREEDPVGMRDADAEDIGVFLRS